MKIIIFLLIFITNVFLLAALLVNIVRWIIKLIKKRDCQHIISILKKNVIILLSVVSLTIIYGYITQVSAYTPQIKDRSGNVVPGSIAELKKVNLNGHNEWISIRGKNKNAPVLLFLAGGPGGTQMAATRYELSELEDNFVVVSWDQPGSGKSYNAMKQSDIKVKTYIEDGIALTKYLQDRFSQEKIYLIGESWGSALGIFLINEEPDYYAGFIGTGQMVDFAETEVYDYKKAMEIAENKGDKKIYQKLKKQGEPLYYDGNVTMKSEVYYNYLSTYMTSDPNITNGGYHTFRDMFSSEYGILDSVNFMVGMVNTFNTVYPQLYETDLRQEYSKLDVPVYFFVGKHDINAPTSLVQEYYNLLEAPKKELVWFERSGHSAWMNEKERFCKETLRVFQK